MDKKDAQTKDSEITTDSFLEKLKRSLQKDGDFPASAKIVADLKRLASDPGVTANQVTETILREPSLGIRILHVVNSSFYRRSKPVMTVSQAVVHIGMKPLSDLCAGLVLMQKFVPTARSGGNFAGCLQKSLVSSLLCGALAKQSGATTPGVSGDESGYLAGSFSELGTLLTAFYFPQLYDSALKRAEQKKLDFAVSLKEIVGLEPIEISLEVLKSLGLPEFYTNILKCATADPNLQSSKIPTPLPGELSLIEKIARTVRVSQDISSSIVYKKDKKALDLLIPGFSKSLNINPEAFGKIIGELPKALQDHCSALELTLPGLPEFVNLYSGGVVASSDASTDGDDRFSQFVVEIRQAVENAEPTASIITSIMETIAWGLSFDRVLLLLLNGSRKALQGRMMLGTSDIDPNKIERPIGSEAGPYACEARAVREGRPVFQGDPIFEDGWPFVCLPVGFDSRCIGVIYADRCGQSSGDVSAQEQAAISVLADLLDRSLVSTK